MKLELESQFISVQIGMQKRGPTVRMSYDSPSNIAFYFRNLLTYFTIPFVQSFNHKRDSFP